MRTINRVLKSLVAILCVLVLAIVMAHQGGASAKFTKETGKKCTDCHKKIPKKGDKELHLTELGEKFKANGNKMPADAEKK